MRQRLLWPNTRNARLFLVGLVLAAVAILAFFYWRSGQKRLPPDIEKGLAQTLRAEQLKTLNQDSDRDGLKDWEEFIFRSDPKNPDTDADGTSDGEEATAGRDPKKPGPDDLIATSTPQEAAEGDGSKNLTRDFTVRFLREPIARLIAGAEPDFDAGSADEYAKRLLAKPVLSAAPSAKLSDIRISSESTQEAMVEYFNNFKTIFDTLAKRGKNEIDIVADVFQSQRYEGLAGLKSYPDEYEKAIKDLKALPVPRSLQQFHLKILAYLEKFKYSTELLQKAESDPILAMLAMNERLKLDEEFDGFLNRSQKDIVAKFQAAR